MLQFPLNIRAKQVELVASLKEHVEKRAIKLEKYQDRITHMNVELRKAAHNDDTTFSCKVNLFVPQHSFHKEASATELHECIDSVFTVMERHLKEVAKKRIAKKRQSSVVPGFDPGTH